jgi:hypothetical protein
MKGKLEGELDALLFEARTVESQNTKWRHSAVSPLSPNQTILPNKNH